MTEEYITVTQLNKYLASKFSQDGNLNRVFLTGEISNFRQRANHQYFAIKDDKSVISATMWATSFKKLDFRLEDGMKVLIVGRVSLYAPNGSYSINVEKIIPDGVGALNIKYEQLKSEFESLGFFDTSYKKPIKQFNWNIGVVTSPSGAVVRDIITTVNRRFPLSNVHVFPTKVQGQGAAEEIAFNIQRANTNNFLDVIIVGRGGGSIEDLWCFNEKIVVQAIFESKVPIISSVGHETDVTLSDFVSDVRAATPTAAAELATSVSKTDLMNFAGNHEQRLNRIVQRQISYKSNQLNKITQSIIFQQPERLYEGLSKKVDYFSEKLIQQLTKSQTNEKNKVTLIENQLNYLIEQRLNYLKNRINLLGSQLKPEYEHLYSGRSEQIEQLNRAMQQAILKKITTNKQELKNYSLVLKPSYEKQVNVNKNRLEKAYQALTLLDVSNIKARGFSITKDQNGNIIKDASVLKEGQILNVEFYKGNKEVKII